MSVLLPEDNKAPGPITTSSLLGFPFLPQGSNQGAAIYNALVRLLDQVVLKKDTGIATNLTADDITVSNDLTALNAIITALTATTGTITTGTVTDLTSTTATLATAIIDALTATAATITTLTATDLSVINAVASMTITALTTTSITSANATLTDANITRANITTLNATTGRIDTLTSTDATIDVLTVGSLSIGTESRGKTLTGLHRFNPTEEQVINPGTSIESTVPINRVSSLDLTLPFKAYSIRGVFIMDVVFNDTGADQQTAKFVIELFEGNDFATVSPSTTTGPTVLVTRKFQLVKPTEFTQATYTTLAPTLVVNQYGESMLQVDWSTDTKQPSVLANYGPGLDLTAVTAGTVGNTLTIEIDFSVDDNTTVTVDTLGDAVTVHGKTTGATPVATTLNEIISALSANSLITAALNSGATGSDTISAAVSLDTLAGGLDYTATTINLLTFSLGGSLGTTLSITSGFITNDGTGFVPHGNYNVESFDIKYFLELDK